MPRSLLETPRGSRETQRSPAIALSSVMTEAGIDPRHNAADVQEALQRAIAMYRYSCTWTKVHAGHTRLGSPNPGPLFVASERPDRQHQHN
jgi:phage baseplate assembly protein W